MAEGFTGPGTDTSPATTYKASGSRGFVYDGSTPPSNGNVPTYDSTAGAYKPAAPSGGGAGGVLSTATLALSSADLLALQDTPRVLIPAVAGVIPVPIFLLGLYTPNTTPYVFGPSGLATVAIGYSRPDGSELAQAGGVVLDVANASDVFQFSPETYALPAQAPLQWAIQANLIGKAIMVGLTQGPLTEGDGTYVFHALYWPVTV